MIYLNFLYLYSKYTQNIDKYNYEYMINFHQLVLQVFLKNFKFSFINSNNHLITQFYPNFYQQMLAIIHKIKI